MSAILGLIKGELKRLVLYKIIPVSLAVSVLWVILFLFLSKEDAAYIAPLLLFVDVTMMTILLIGASHHLEKQEGTIKSMMVMPVSLGQILLAKFVGSMVLGIESLIVISVALYFIHGLTFNYAWMLLFVLIAGAAHGAIGFFLAHNSKDFGSMIGWVMIFLFIFAIPSVLFTFGIIDVQYEWVMMFSPTHAASNLINSTFAGIFEWGKVIFACIYLTVLAALLLKLAVYPMFKKNAIRG